MSNHSNSTIDEVKGRAKEAAGALSGDDELRREGRTDQAAADIKDAVNGAVDKGRDLVNDAREKLSGDEKTAR